MSWLGHTLISKTFVSGWWMIVETWIKKYKKLEKNLKDSFGPQRRYTQATLRDCPIPEHWAHNSQFSQLLVLIFIFKCHISLSLSLQYNQCVSSSNQAVDTYIRVLIQLAVWQPLSLILFQSIQVQIIRNEWIRYEMNWIFQVYYHMQSANT